MPDPHGDQNIGYHPTRLMTQHLPGVVNLFAQVQSPGSQKSHWLFPSGGQGGTRDLPPALESFLHLLTIGGSGQPMPTRAEMLGDGTIDGERALSVARRLEWLHTPSRWRVG